MPVMEIHDRLEAMLEHRHQPEAVSILVVVPEALVDPPVVEAAKALAAAEYPGRTVGEVLHIESLGTNRYEVVVGVR